MPFLTQFALAMTIIVIVIFILMGLRKCCNCYGQSYTVPFIDQRTLPQAKSGQFRQRMINLKNRMEQSLGCCRNKPQQESPTAPPEEFDIERNEPELKVRFTSPLSSTYIRERSPDFHLPPPILKNQK